MQKLKNTTNHVVNYRQAMSEEKKSRIRIDIKTQSSITFFTIKTSFEQIGYSLMQTRVILLSLLAFYACCQITTPIWDNWVLPTWTATWQYNISWAPPTPLSGYGRNVIGQSNDPADNYFYLRSNHYLWTNTSDAKYKYICGPETYLNGSALCVKNPKYWNSSSSASEYCIPEKITKGVRITCETVYSASVSACCYRSSSDDLRNIYRQASIYPPGA